MLLRLFRIKIILEELIKIFGQLAELHEVFETLIGQFGSDVTNWLTATDAYEIWNLTKGCDNMLCIIGKLRDTDVLSAATIDRVRRLLLNTLDGLEYNPDNLDWDTLEILFSMPERFRSFSFKFGDEVITLPWVWVRNGELIPADSECLEKHAPEKKHPAQLTGWPLANYMNCVISKREVIYRELINETEGTFWQNIHDNDVMYWLPDLNPSVYIQSIDPLDPLAIESYAEWVKRLPICGTLDEEGKEVYPCKGSVTNSGFLWNNDSGIYRQFIPLQLTSADNAYIDDENNPSGYNRPYLADATIALWNFIGINQSPEEISAWADSREHAGINEEARGYTSEVFHYAYSVFLRQTGDREEAMRLLVEWTSVSLFRQKYTNPSTLELRDRPWLMQITSPPLPVQDNGASYLDMMSASNLDWETGSADYEHFTDAQLFASIGETPRTFGSTEVNQIPNQENIDLFKENPCNLFWVSNQGGESGVYVMTPDQQSNAIRMQRGESPEVIIAELGGCKQNDE